MKKKLSFAVTAMAILGLGSLTSCHDEDFGASTAVLQERAFEQNFIKEFGQPSADQSWDFYAQMMGSLGQETGATRAAMAEGDITFENKTQPTAEWFTDAVADANRALQNEKQNQDVGQQNYSLVATGDFNIYAIHYGGNIQADERHQFEFGIAYKDAQGTEHPTKLFGYYGTANTNPKYGATVHIEKGTRFYFYIKYRDYEDWNEQVWSEWFNRYVEVNRRHYLPRTFYSNQTPSCLIHSEHSGDGSSTTTKTWSDYSGTSTLLYTDEHDNKQIMVIGIEDGWGYRVCGDGHPDYDYNDIIIMLEGNLPIPTAKRFFCEDRTAYDWDYNDVVFDVTNTGVVLRAVGGTLPVWLRVTDRRGNVTTTEELHELMSSLQTESTKQNRKITYTSGGKTYYKPMEVAANPGINFDAVQIVVWDMPDMAGGNATTYKALDDGMVERFANPMPGVNKVGDVELLVGSKYGDTAGSVLASLDVNAENKDDQKHIVKMGDPGTIPAMWSAPVSVRWMKERQKITLAYPGFYGGGDPDDLISIPMWWTVDANPDPYTYNFTGDVDPDYTKP